MNPVNATALYVSASRLVLNYDPGDPQSFTEINKLLPYFRQSLSCCVCGEDLSFVPCTMSPCVVVVVPPPPGACRTAALGRAAPAGWLRPGTAAGGNAGPGPFPPRPREPGSRTEAARETFTQPFAAEPPRLSPLPPSLSPPGGAAAAEPTWAAALLRGGRWRGRGAVPHVGEGGGKIILRLKPTSPPAKTNPKRDKSAGNIGQKNGRATGVCVFNGPARGKENTLSFLLRQCVLAKTQHFIMVALFHKGYGSY